MSQIDLRGIEGVVTEPTPLFRHETLRPKSQIVIIPINENTLPIIKRHILSRVGLRDRVAHIKIGVNDRIVFVSYDWFDKDMVWVSAEIGEERLRSLLEQHIIWKYEPTFEG